MLFDEIERLNLRKVAFTPRSFFVDSSIAFKYMDQPFLDDVNEELGMNQHMSSSGKSDISKNMSIDTLFVIE